MKQTTYHFIANWKMYRPYQETISWLNDYAQQLDKVFGNQNTKFILCPSFPALAPANQILQSTRLELGAQNCSAYTSGAYTGQVSAQSLQEVGCSYCIVGHSERRTLFNESTELIAQKASQLLTRGLIPIICIGESTKEKTADINHLVDELIAKQLKPIIDIIGSILKKENNPAKTKILIAYEPSWAIGTGKTPQLEKLCLIFEALARFTQTAPYDSMEFKLLYGGSVSGQNSQPLTKIEHLSGLLIGKSSLDFQELKKIVSWFV